jgi:hypothetical protein
MRLDPKLADAYFSKALPLEAMGRPDTAREAYAAFIRHAPRKPRIRSQKIESGCNNNHRYNRVFSCGQD